VLNLLAVLFINKLEFARVSRISGGKGNFLILGGIPEVKASFWSKLTLSRESMGIKLDLEPK